MRSFLKVLALVVASQPVFAASLPRVELRSDDRATLTFFQRVESSIEGNAALGQCYERVFGTNEINRREYRFSGLILPNGQLSFERDQESKENNVTWARLPETYRQNDACLRENLSRGKFPRPDEPVRIEISLIY